MPDTDQPWRGVAPIALPVVLHRAGSAALDQMFDLPAGSAMSIAEVNQTSGDIRCADWRGSGEWGFYPASSIKLITAAMTLRFLDGHQLPIDAALKLGDEKPMSFRELLAETIVFSGNDTFDILQETVGFAETQAALRQWGLVKLLIRRHFKNPRYNHSRPVTIFSDSGKMLLEIPSRPAVEMPMHDGNGNENQNLASNWACTDDLIRVMAAVLFGPTRQSRYFDQFTGWCGMTNRCNVRAGLRAVTAELPTHPAFVILNKAGWWPPDSVNVDFGYIHDVAQRHYLYAIYVHGTEEAAEATMASVFQRVFGELHATQPGAWGLDGGR